jgi:hypothetical protein
MRILLLAPFLALLGCASMVRVVDKSEDQVALSYLPSQHLDAAILAEQTCARYDRRAEFAWETRVDDRVVATWACKR